MKKLSELYNCKLDININGIKNNSMEVKKGDLFVCTKGINCDRHEFINNAIRNGCSALIVSKEGNYSVPYIKVDDTNLELGKISKKFYDNPCDNLKIIGVTGTDGKTTTASIIRNMLGNNTCGYIGTNGVYCKDKKTAIKNTTPEINKTYEFLSYFVDNGLKYTTMEISSEALLHNRTNTLELDIAILTNITEDHLNVHKTINNYIKSKEKIFKLLKKDGIAILNRDDRYYDRIVKNIKNNVLTYGKSIYSDLVIIDIKEYDTGTIFTFNFEEKIYKVIMSLIGEFNVYNICAALLSLKALGYSIENAIERITQIENVYGRCEFLEFGQDYKIVLDYAHTANALEKILTYLNKIKKNKIITVTGSAGGREKQKRSKMGEIVLSLSDFVIFTMDDPREESVEDIINQMISSSKNTNYLKIINREEAIKKALSIAQKDDIVLIAGKGRDNYMAIKNKEIDYCDFDIIDSFFKADGNN